MRRLRRLSRGGGGVNLKFATLQKYIDARNTSSNIITSSLDEKLKAKCSAESPVFWPDTIGILSVLEEARTPLTSGQDQQARVKVEKHCKKKKKKTIKAQGN
ncbi:unnamed protein product, partial [Trichogramma brassicae]